jgi:hypothetical protein
MQFWAQWQNDPAVLEHGVVEKENSREFRLGWD